MKYKCAVEKAKNLIVWRREGEKKNDGWKYSKCDTVTTIQTDRH